MSLVCYSLNVRNVQSEGELFTSLKMSIVPHGITESPSLETKNQLHSLVLLPWLHITVSSLNRKWQALTSFIQSVKLCSDMEPGCKTKDTNSTKLIYESLSRSQDVCWDTWEKKGRVEVPSLLCLKVHDSGHSHKESLFPDSMVEISNISIYHFIS